MHEFCFSTAQSSFLYGGWWPGPGVECNLNLKPICVYFIIPSCHPCFYPVKLFHFQTLTFPLFHARPAAEQRRNAKQLLLPHFHIFTLARGLTLLSSRTDRFIFKFSNRIRYFILK